MGCKNEWDADAPTLLVKCELCDGTGKVWPASPPPHPEGEAGTGEAWDELRMALEHGKPAKAFAILSAALAQARAEAFEEAARMVLEELQHPERAQEYVAFGPRAVRMYASDLRARLHAAARARSQR